ncbi:metal ABC transporter solute-binding protein, Zn/Mn family [Pusillimonas minor]|uniref:Zinc ABC transporter substrate-binding protein n=1 Tax=Pusillimonas minor TaxID=2697024 RepID=A0A842HJL7_9BURK|nr:zinc ABC transporter substrate-binding protein [Pusillimonas minor]MBC2768869.1 zinc ABC transporter substrate-binding protein [Pusillimonas minor]
MFLNAGGVPGQAGFARLRRLCAVGLGLLAAALAAPLSATAEPLKVVASFSILGDMVKVIGGENVQVTTLIGPNADAHSHEPSASDSRVLAEANVVVMNGLGFEAWMPRLLRASGFNGHEIVASTGVTPRQLDHDHDHGHSHGHDDKADGAASVDPHAWQDLQNGVKYARNIANGLSRVDPVNRAGYQARADIYVTEMEKLHNEIRQSLAAIPVERRKVVTPHDAFGYFGQAYDITFVSVAGLASDAEPSARDIARLIREIKKTKSAALFTEKALSSRVINQIARETGAKVGGTLYADTLDVTDRPAGTYLGMFKWNAGQLIFSLKP